MLFIINVLIQFQLRRHGNCTLFWNDTEFCTNGTQAPRRSAHHQARSVKREIILPEAAKKKPQRGTVLAVGPGKMNDDGSRTPLQVKVGDRVLFTSWAGDEFQDRNRKDEVLVMHESDILAVLA